MEQKLDFLRKYCQDIRVVPNNEISHIGIGLIPNSWRVIFKELHISGRKEALLSLWKQNVGTELRNTISYLTENLEDIELMESYNGYSLLYTVKNSKGDILYYEGLNTLRDFENDELEKYWSKIPVSLRNFYENVHNGFYYYASESMGLVPISSVTYLGDDDLDWGIIDELEEPLQIDLDTSFGFFSNGMGSYIVIDSMNCKNNLAAFWSAKSQPKYNIDFWSYVDEWIVLGFEA